MRFQTVLAATDLRDEPDLAAENGARFAEWTGASLHVFHCTPDSERASAEAARSALARRAPGAAVEATAGRPHVAIGAQARRLGADLLVLGPRRRRRELALLLGSTSDRVLRTTRVPCLLSNATLPMSPGLLLIPLDASAHSRRALRAAAALADTVAERSSRLVVHLLHISAYAEPGGASVTGSVDVERIAERLAARFGPRVSVNAQLHSAPFAADGILEACGRLEPALVIMGTHGDGPFVRALLGGVALSVAHSADHPVLLVPKPARRQHATP